VSQAHPRRPNRRPRRAVPTLEPIEGRALLSAGLDPPVAVRVEPPVAALDEPVVPGPAIVDVRANSFRGRTHGLVLTFDRDLDPATAIDRARYRLSTVGRDRRFRTADDARVAIQSAVYDESRREVTLRLARPLEHGQFVRLSIGENGAPAPLDLLGNALDGDGDGQAGGAFDATFNRLPIIRYTEADGDLVTLRLVHGGTLEFLQDARGNSVRLRFIGVKPGRSQLLGTFVRGRVGDGLARLGPTVGDQGVRFRLAQPPFEIAIPPAV